MGCYFAPRLFSSISQLLFVVAGLVFLTGCRDDIESKVHLIPEGYEGPVVILFGIPTGENLRRDEEGAEVYRIPSEGVLKVKAQAQVSGWYRITHYYEAPDGARKELPYGHKDEPSLLQVFAEVDGVTGMIDGIPVEDMRWRAYVVGVPADRKDWVQLREKATREAILKEVKGGK